MRSVSASPREQTDLVMISRARMADLAGVSQRRIDYWERTGLIRSSLDTSLQANRRIRLYDFTEAMTALVLAALRERVSLQHVRLIVAHLKELRYGVTQVRFAIAGQQVHIQLPDGTWSGIKDPNQIVLHEVLDLEPLRARLLSTRDRRTATEGTTEKRRGVHGSRPVIAGTRVSLSAVRAYIDRGLSTEEILEAYPALTATDVEHVRSLATA